MIERPYSSAWDPDNKTLRVSGAVDELAASRFRDDAQRHLAAGGPGAVLDLTDVDFFPSLAVGALVGAMRVDGPGELWRIEVRVRKGSVPHRVLQICGLPHRIV